jgi:hypothetical protein
VLEIPTAPTKAFYATNAASVTTGDAAVPFTALTTAKDGNNMIVSGKIDTTKIAGNFDPAQFSAVLYFSTTVPKTGAASLTNTTGPLNSRKTPDANGAVGINDDGTYYWYLNQLTPSTIYYIQQFVTSTGNKNPTPDVIDSFNSSDGTIIAPGSAAQQADLNQRSYTLLSGFPGFTNLPDPDLCAQQRAAGQHPKFCDINDVLNYSMQLLIGLAGVVLVMRLMFEGYQYMVTDVPFLKASAKAGFFTALLGLLLALSSYLILNTINPKLVNESINIQQLAIGVTAPDIETAPLTQNGGLPSGPSGACTAGITTVAVQASSFPVCSTYNGIPIAKNLQSMLTAAYASGIVLKGYGYRSSTTQTALRIKNCSGDTTNPNAVCNPLTAPVGHSNHESGLAIDFNCNGGSAYQIKNTNCYTWLQSNAATYGFKNLPSEPWHWSWNGQ